MGGIIIGIPPQERWNERKNEFVIFLIFCGG